MVTEHWKSSSSSLSSRIAARMATGTPVSVAGFSSSVHEAEFGWPKLRPRRDLAPTTVAAGNGPDLGLVRTVGIQTAESEVNVDGSNASGAFARVETEVEDYQGTKNIAVG
ncbi:hypothetical protein QC763_0061360 [Podospora pseudopauciseta]|uniref:Uncharacterized protein n=2 Tax=Podospora TaxID=5144 RepID=A0ABR0HBT9_9PEZI|nr:hypothetical protein QC763_0061360 [Podospora pseudopauciseta]KAK4676490.1 hypothetical protein QC764_401035 [Podospora pseudoanserina]